MAKTRTVRISEELLEMVDTYVKQHNSLFDVSVTAQSVIESCIKAEMVKKTEVLTKIKLSSILDEIE